MIPHAHLIAYLAVIITPRARNVRNWVLQTNVLYNVSDAQSEIWRRCSTVTRGTASSYFTCVPSTFSFWGSPNINRLQSSLGNRPHLPPEVPLSPWKQPAVRQAKDAAARVHPEALCWESHVPGSLLYFCISLFIFISVIYFFGLI